MALASTPGQGTDRLIDFRLKGTDERMYSLEDIRGQNGTLLMFHLQPLSVCEGSHRAAER